jgi:hypothetical protein
MRCCSAWRATSNGVGLVGWHSSQGLAVPPSFAVQQNLQKVQGLDRTEQKKRAGRPER